MVRPVDFARSHRYLHLMDAQTATAPDASVIDREEAQFAAVADNAPVEDEPKPARSLGPLKMI